jgi:hypothetical protein
MFSFLEENGNIPGDGDGVTHNYFRYLFIFYFTMAPVCYYIDIPPLPIFFP